MPNKLLSPSELRVIGCLIEKSLTTPEIYPLSLNALTNACNQKSNREPVMNLAEAEVQDVVEALVKQGLVSAQTGFGSRVAKYKHRFCNTEFSDLQFSAQELGIVVVMFLRGPQTAGELRTRTNRMCEFDSLETVEKVLQAMQDKGWVRRLAREPGKREARFAHTFGDESVAQTQAVASEARPDPLGAHDRADPISDRLERAEARIADLEARLQRLEELLT